MKRAFDANVSRSRPRTRIGRSPDEQPVAAEQEASAPAPAAPPVNAELERLREEAARRVAAARALATAQREERQPVEALSADLAAAMVRTRTAAPVARVRSAPGSLAEAAGAAAAAISAARSPRHEAPADGLSRAEEQQAQLASAAAEDAREELAVEELAAASRAEAAARAVAREELAVQELAAASRAEAAARAAIGAANEAASLRAVADAEAAAAARAAPQPPAWIAAAATPDAGESRTAARTAVLPAPPQAGTVSADLAATLLSDSRAAARPVEEEARAATRAPLSADLAGTLARAHAGRPRAAAPAAETVVEGKARIAELRQRLQASARPAVTAEEVAPATAAATVRAAVEELRARLASAAGERDALGRALETTRDELGKAQKELASKDRALQAAQTLAAERGRVADELVAEAEALAEERDRSVGRIGELKSLDEQQTRLLAEAQEALTARDEELAAASAQAAELTAALDARAAETEELSARLAERTLERDQLQRRLAQLDGEVGRLLASREALAEIQRLVEAVA